MNLKNYDLSETIHENERFILYRGRRQEDDLPILLKFFRSEYPSSEEISRIRHEYQVGLSLHKEIHIPILQLEKFNQNYFLVLEDPSAIPILNHWNFSHQTDSIFLDFVIPLVELIKTIHNQKIIIKNISPLSFFLQKETNRILIMDLGTSSTLLEEEQSPLQPERIEGFLPYIAPEQSGRMNRSIDFRTDLYSLGILFYELITGQRPFSSKDPVELVHSHIAKIPTPPIEIRSSCNLSLSNMILKLLEKNPEDRYQSILSLNEDLLLAKKQISDGQLISFVPQESENIKVLRIPQKLYGREAELSFLLDAYEKVSNRPSQESDQINEDSLGGIRIVTIGGPSGVGKTALIGEINKPILEKKGFFISGKFEQYKKNIPYYAIVQAFSQLFKQLLTGNKESIDQWKLKIHKSCGSDIQILLDIIPELTYFVSSKSELPELSLKELEEKFLSTFDSLISTFSDYNHPLVLFLDDLQWADLASLKFLQYLMNSRSAQSLLILLAYRDNEVDSIHPFVLMIQGLEENSHSILKIHISSLPEFFVQKLLLDTLSLNKITDLVELVFQKTKGNPFFIKQFLKEVYRAGFIYYDQNSWKYDLEKIQSEGYTENVVDLVSSRIQLLPFETQVLLKIASCIGASFKLDLISEALDLEPIKASSLLEEGIREGVLLLEPQMHRLLQTLIKDSGDSFKDFHKMEYRFLHDRVQQAAYSLLSVSELNQIHSKLGQLIYEKYKDSNLNDHLIEIVNHLNFKISEDTSPKDRIFLAELNQRASQKAIDTLSYSLGIQLSKKGLSLLNREFEEHRELNRKLQFQLMLSLYLNANLEESLEIGKVLLPQLDNRKDRTIIYRYLVSICATLNQLETSIQLGIDCLKDFGIYININSVKMEVIKEIKKMNLIWETKKVEDLYHSPKMISEDHIELLNMLIFLSSASYLGNSALSSLVTLFGVKISLEFGISQHSAVHFANYGGVMSAMGQLQLGNDLSMLAIKLANESNSPNVKAAVLHSYNLSTSHWNQHARNNIQVSKECFNYSLESGDRIFAGYAIIISNLIKSQIGTNIKTQIDEIKSESAMIKKVRYEVSSLALDIILNISYAISGNQILDQYNYLSLLDEDSMIQSIRESNSKDSALYVYLNRKIMVMFLFRIWDGIEEILNHAQKISYHSSGQMLLVEENFFSSLALIKLSKKDLSLLGKVKNNQKQLKKWADHCKENFQHKYDLVEAELAVLEEDFWKAKVLYQRSIDSALENDYIQNAAVAYELAGEFYKKNNLSKDALQCLRDAAYYYELWGAEAKVMQLKFLYPEIYYSQRKDSREGSLTSFDSASIYNQNTLDTYTILKTNVSISAEIQIDKILESVISAIQELTGAQRILWITSNQEHIYLEAERDINSGVIRFYKGMEAKEFYPLPDNLIQYTLNSKQPIILDDASNDSRFTKDEYIQKVKSKSMVSYPIALKNQIVGILILENNSATGIFSKERIQWIQMLTLQAAISIENARLYDSLEEKVRIRTTELEEQRLRLERIQSFTTMIQNALDFETMVKNINTTFLENFGLGSYLFYFCNKQSKKLDLIYSVSDRAYPDRINNALTEYAIPFEEPNSTHNAVMKYKKPVYFKNAKRGNLSITENEIRKLLDISCLYVIPLINSGEVFAIISFADTSNEFQKEQNLKKLSRIQRSDIELLCQSIASGLYQTLQKKELESQKKSIEKLNDFIKNLNESSNLKTIFDKIQNYLSVNYNIEHSTLGLVDESEEYARFIESNLFLNEELKNFVSSIKIPIKDAIGPHAYTFKANKPFYSKRISTNRITKEEKKIIEMFNFKFFLILPLVLNGKNIGFLDLANSQNTTLLSKDQINQLSILAEQLAGIIYSSNLYNQLEFTLTELRSTQAQLVEVEKSAALGQLISGIAHEINNPLATIRSSAEIMEMDQAKLWEEVPRFFQKSSTELLELFLVMLKESEAKRRHLTTREERQRKKMVISLFENISFKNTTLKHKTIEILTDLWLEELYISFYKKYSEEELLQILNFIYIFSTQKSSIRNIRFSTEKSSRVIFSLRKYLQTAIRGTPREISLLELIDSSLDVYINYIQGIVLIEKKIPEDLRIVCEVHEIQQVFKNIIFNAIQAMYSSATKILTIEALPWNTKESSMVSIKFEDSGIGIASDLTPKLFTPFFTTKSRGEGIGLGLYISKGIAEEHGGSLRFEPKALGSRFEVVLKQNLP